MTADGVQPLTDGVVTLRRVQASDVALRFDVFHSGQRVAEVGVVDRGGQVGELTWVIEDPQQRGQGYATRAVRLLVTYAFAELDYLRLEALAPADNRAAHRVGSRAGLRREGVRRGPDHDWVVLARLRDDPDPYQADGFRALLNSALPRKRAIAQLAVRDRQGRLLLCQLTYKQDWDFPGGVVEDDESPRVAAERECREELGLELTAGRLLVVDWLPAWGGWDDACVFMFDGGTVDASIVDRIVPEPREIRAAEFCDEGQIAERCADFTARRAAALDADAVGPLRYLESGR
ncbi:MAG: GNAT family N-acetyltransferase [Propionibacteriales bacterium]|nr:GNAT family N-acetyltransferase [Propionibacteriales bacterium]